MEKLILYGYRLTTAEILYHLPDHPKLLQSFVWQEFDLAPQYPVLRKFIDFWTVNIEGKLHSVTVGQKEIITPAAYHFADQELIIH